MSFLILLPPVAFWFLSLGGFLTIFKNENPQAYYKLDLLSFFKRKKSDDAARVIDFFWHQKHLKLGGKTALAGMALNIVFCLCVIYMFVILWLGWTGRIN
ncbi:hypothetical protein [Halomonas citrativorans]|uniref:hypothetical protein n=1 Tax=Halomonas citrativorans TaxID=2742612 RepID=UPI000B34FE64|nr:hypothetical protein [Halomonas citrativorans]